MRCITLGKYINKYFQCYLNIVTYNLAVIRWEVKCLGMTVEWEFKHQHKQDTARTIANSPAAHSTAWQRDTVWVIFAVAAASWALDIDDWLTDWKQKLHGGSLPLIEWRLGTSDKQLFRYFVQQQEHCIHNTQHQPEFLSSKIFLLKYLYI